MVNCEFSSLELYEMLEAAYPEMKDWTKRDVEEIKKHLTLDSRVLDAGCGWGRVIRHIAPSCREIVGIDIDSHEVAFARTYLADMPNVHLHIQNMEDTTFPDQSFDAIISIGNTFGNLGASKVPVLKEMKRLLKPDGKIMISVYSAESNKKRAAAYEKIGFAIERIMDGQIIFDNGYISEGFTDESIQDLFDEIDMNVRIIKIAAIGSFIIGTNRQYS